MQEFIFTFTWNLVEPVLDSLPWDEKILPFMDFHYKERVWRPFPDGFLLKGTYVCMHSRLHGFACARCFAVNRRVVKGRKSTG